MKVAIFYDSSSVSKANAIKDIVSSHKCNVLLYDESLQIFDKVHELMKDITHVLFIYKDFEKNTISPSW